MNKRLLANRVVHNGSMHPLSLVEISQNEGSGLWTVKISPFVSETHSTSFVDGTLVVESDTKPSLREPTVKII